MDSRVADLVHREIKSKLAKFGFASSMVAVEARSGVTEVIMSVRFPRAVYGVGRDWCRVRCVAPDGTELGAVGYVH
jgi:hypothetical protein